MNIDPKVKRLINSKKFNSLLDEEDLQGIYNLDEIRKNPYTIGHLTELFLRCGINPLDYMTEIPELFARTIDFSGIDFKIPPKIEKIGSAAFAQCTNLTNIKIPSSVTHIGDSAFYNCSNLKNITLPASVKNIGYGAFKFCSNLTSVTFAENSQLTSIDGYTFYECTSLTSITIPESVTSIGDGAFYRCSNLKSITIPESVTSIGSYAFFACKKLNDIYYQGTREQWLSLSPHNNTGRTIHCSDGDVL